MRLFPALQVALLALAFLGCWPMRVSAGQSPYLYGIHDADPNPAEYLNRIMSGAGPGWVTATVAVGADTNDLSGVDFRPIPNQGHTVICRINHGYFPTGTIPLPAKYDDFAQRCANFVAHSPGCAIWIIGNELNIAGEWPANPSTRRCAYVTPASYASCFRKVYNAIKAVHPNDQVIPQAPAPFSGPFGSQSLPYMGTNYISDPNPLNWVQHLNAMLTAIKSTGPLDGIALHVTSRGYGCTDIHSTQKVNANGQNLYFSFYVYKDWVNLGIPPALYNLPVYVTECNGYFFWKGGHPENPAIHYQPGWMQAVYAEINRYNQGAFGLGKPVIRCLNMYRWCAWCDGWNIDGDDPYKAQILSDLDQAVAQKYTWPTNLDSLVTPLGFNFVNPADATRTSIGLCEGAGVVPQRGWFNLTAGGSGAFQTEGGVTINWSSPGGTHSLPLTNFGGDFALIRGYLDSTDSSTTSVTVTGLKFPFYDLIVYAAGDNGSATRVGQYLLNNTISKYVRDNVSNPDFAGAYTEADSISGGPDAAPGNYCRFRRLTGSRFTLTAHGEFASDGHPRAPLNALQIVPVQAPPIITQQPQSQKVNLGADATFTVSAAGTAPISYQWRFNGAELAAATYSILSLTHVRTNDAGYYSVLLSNPASQLLSSNALLQVNRPPVADASATRTPLIASDGMTARVILDGSRSYDPDGDALQYLWFINNSSNTLATGVVAIVTLPIGAHPVTLVVSDGMAQDTNSVRIDVLTLSQALDRLIQTVSQSGLSHLRPLLASLEAAQGSVARGHPTPAINQLRAFQNKVQAQVAPSEPSWANRFNQAAQQIINALAGVPATGQLRQVTPQGQVSLTGAPGQTYIIESSTNLLDWEMLGVATDLGNGAFKFDDPSPARSSRRFYRVVSP